MLTAIRFRVDLRGGSDDSSEVNTLSRVFSPGLTSTTTSSEFPRQPPDSDPSSRISTLSLCNIFLTTCLFKDPTQHSPLRRYAINATRISNHCLRSTGSQK